MNSRITSLLVFAVLASVSAAILYATRESWRPTASAVDEPLDESAARVEPTQTLKLTPQGRKNLGLVVKPIGLQSYWRSIYVPGTIVDRPGHTDRGVTAPLTAVVSEIHAFPGDTVLPSAPLFTLRPYSEALQTAQSELFKATHEIRLLQEELARLEVPARSGAIPRVRIIELENQQRRQAATITANEQYLRSKGLTPSQIDGVTRGEFIATIEVTAPASSAESDSSGPGGATLYEVQDLTVELGQQVEAGGQLARLANHRMLYVEGHAFKSEAPGIARAAQNAWPVRVEFQDDSGEEWPPLTQPLTIRHISNAINVDSRTFSFYIALENQSRRYQQQDDTFFLWRFRPGQRVTLLAPVEELRDVIVLPTEAVVREGPEAYVFRQNGPLFDRRPVEVLYEDRVNVVLPNGGGVRPGLYLAHNGAASLNRVLKAQAASGAPTNLHVHPDGTVHEAH